ncbi:AAA family ATPase [Neosynechococcus sphagnicola]|uniref:AAA family ATPase n=1 Tax=Neosynechococcus sphagnicola TaxID=1501145 RepID=UPI000A45E1FB|nr:AAA family ATPase [Neosynechococcus sphagnicola]
MQPPPLLKNPSTNSHPLVQLSDALSQTIVGQKILVQQLLVALLTGGHVILEGVPGTGKTLLVKVLAQLIQADFRRIQLTPDILPSDILGTSIFDLNTSTFRLKQGPIFTQVLLADEINRTPPENPGGTAGSYGRTTGDPGWGKSALVRPVLGDCHPEFSGV